MADKMAASKAGSWGVKTVATKAGTSDHWSAVTLVALKAALKAVMMAD